MEAPGTDEELSIQILVKAVDISPEGPNAASDTEEDSISESDSEGDSLPDADAETLWRECGDGGWTLRALAKCFRYKQVRKLSLQNAG